MQTLTKAALIVLALSTAACTRPDRFGAGNSVDLNAAGGAGGIGMSGLGDVNDPTSPAYFSKTSVTAFCSLSTNRPSLPKAVRFWTVRHSG